MRANKALSAVAAILLACVPAMAQPADPSPVLADLSRMLAAKPGAARCPANTKPLVGLPLGRILVELGQSDMPQDPKQNAITYAARNSSGGAGGFPQVIFRFDAQGVVSTVECRPSK